jgi:molybdate transport system substrate-binding protein
MRNSIQKLLQVISVAMFGFFFQSLSVAADMNVMASVAFKDAYLEMQPEFEKITGKKINTLWLPTVEMVNRLKAGEKFDLIIMSAINIEQLMKEGRLQNGSRQDYVKSIIGVGVPKGAKKPDLSTAQTTKEALLNAKSVGYSTGPSGVYLAGLFDRMGIAQQLKPKLKIVQGEPVGALVERGEIELALQQVPEILSVPKIDYAGPLPAELNHTTIFSFALMDGTQNRDLVLAWMNFLREPKAVPIIQKYGLNPAW